MAESPAYTIAEAAALTGLHRNTIRLRIKLGTLAATVQAGKFGDEYRIPHEALVAAGLLQADGAPMPPGETEAQRPAERAPRAAPAPRMEAVLLGEGGEEATDAGTSSGPEGGSSGAPPPLEALTELYRRHEHAMFRLGYLQGELERLKALAETAESLREEHQARNQELEELREVLAERTREAEAARRHQAAEQRLREELHEARERLRAMENLREEIEALKLEVQRRRPWWRLWR
jgi:excisionase family DNA binding protein